MTEQLKPLPCPFCGGTDIRAHVYGGGEPDAFMQCHDCSADGPNGLNRAGAIEAWNRRTQPAQAVPVLTDAEIDTAYEKARVDYQRSRFRVCGQQLTASDSFDWWFARAIEQAVRAKMGVAVPMTDEQADDILLSCMPLTNPHRLIRAAENFHGVVGEKGGA